MTYIYHCKTCNKYSLNMEDWVHAGLYGKAMISDLLGSLIELVETLCENCEQTQPQLPFKRGSK